MRAKEGETYRVRLFNDSGKMVSVVTDDMFTSIGEMVATIVRLYNRNVNNKYQVEITNLDTEEHSWYSIKGRKIN